MENFCHVHKSVNFVVALHNFISFTITNITTCLSALAKSISSLSSFCDLAGGGAGLEGIGAACEDDCDDVGGGHSDSGDDFEAKTNSKHYI